MSKRDLSLDYIKGILILFVVYGHCLYWLDGNRNSFNYYFLPKIIYSFHMPLFIFLSGYFFSAKINANIYSTTTEKFKRLIIPHFFFNFIMLIPIFCLWGTYGHFITRFSNGIITISSIYHYFTMFWFLWCVFISCIITNIVHNCANNKKKGNIILILLSILFLFISKFQIIHIIIDHQHIGTMFFFFTIGIITHDDSTLFLQKTTKYCASLLYITYISLLYVKPEIDNLIISEIGNLAGLICAYNLFRLFYNLKISTRFVSYISKWTLSIYIYHFIFLYSIMKPVNLLYEKYDSIIIVVINLLIAILVTYTIAWLSERLSTSPFLRRYAFGK